MSIVLEPIDGIGIVEIGYTQASISVCEEDGLLFARHLIQQFGFTDEELRDGN